MRNVRRAWLGVSLLSTAAVLSVFLGTSAGADDRRAGCRVPIGDVPGVTRAWVLEQESRAAHVAWCARNTRGQVVYDLAIATASQRHPWASCPSRVPLGINVPYPDLRTVVLPRDLPYPMTLRNFWYLRGNDFVADGGPYVDRADVPTGPAIDFGASASGQLVLCLGNRWIIAGYH